MAEENNKSAAANCGLIYSAVLCCDIFSGPPSMEVRNSETIVSVGELESCVEQEDEGWALGYSIIHR